MPCPLAPAAGERERQRDADQKRERGLDQIVQRAAGPFDVRLMIGEELPELAVAGSALATRANRSTSAIIRNMTRPR